MDSWSQQQALASVSTCQGLSSRACCSTSSCLEARSMPAAERLPAESSPVVLHSVALGRCTALSGLRPTWLTTRLTQLHPAGGKLPDPSPQLTGSSTPCRREDMQACRQGVRPVAFPTTYIWRVLLALDSAIVHVWAVGAPVGPQQLGGGQPPAPLLVGPGVPIRVAISCRARRLTLGQLMQDAFRVQQAHCLCTANAG